MFSAFAAKKPTFKWIHQMVGALETNDYKDIRSNDAEIFSGTVSIFSPLYQPARPRI